MEQCPHAVELELEYDVVKFESVAFSSELTASSQASIKLCCCSVIKIKATDLITAKSQMESPNNGGIPEDLLLEILLRLTVKDLLRFKSVCKRWYSIIRNPDFVNQHFTHKSNQEYLLIRHYRYDLEQYAFAMYLDENFSKYEEPDNLQLPFTVSALMGPINGVFWAAGISGHMALLNPATRQFKPISLLLPDIPPYLSLYDHLFGFGLDSRSGDYKVISIQYYWNGETDMAHHPCIISVYTSSSDSWKHFEDSGLVNSSRCVYRSLCNTYLKGSYYWIMDNDKDVAILAFDVKNESFREIRVPDCIKTKEGDLSLYGDSLALLTCDLDNDIRWPLGFWKENELLIETENSVLTMYDVSARKSRTVENRRKENGFFIYWVFSYKESLVSIEGEGEGDCHAEVYRKNGDGLVNCTLQIICIILRKLDIVNVREREANLQSF
ncbi:F-box and associated interaction domains-containing protein [Striga asiatica]|uniref:F-box and associated interaction domains-containing protein n=1 Tax=Striga asiatica TaxID=4170 RepID=A0A5A7P9K3_STRAF|nr:F-box and associated interaction domains-containing protein [Striga asiatica]